jgi:hypothetical protein
VIGQPEKSRSTTLLDGRFPDLLTEMGAFFTPPFVVLCAPNGFILRIHKTPATTRETIRAMRLTMTRKARSETVNCF